MRFLKQQILWLTGLSLLAGSCKKEEQNVAPTDDNETITTATLTLTNKAAPTEIVTASIENLNTTANFSKAVLNVKANATYTGVLTLLDKTKTPVLDVSEAVKGEANEHLVVYTPTPANLLTVTSTDQDTNPAPGPYPLGLTTEWKTGPAGSGNLKVVLRHQPNVKNGKPAPGTSDLDTDFTVVVR
ncbi:hypothetical protein [Spirosoma areae]